MDNQMTPAGAAIESTPLKPCTWREDADGNWHTGCQQIHVIIDGTPSENGYAYCPYCGLKIETVIYNILIGIETDNGDAAGSLRAEGIRMAAGDGRAARLVAKAAANMAKWGMQDFQTLGLAVAEEAGELAQAILQHLHEGGERDRICDEAVDLGALCLQVMAHFSVEPVGTGQRGRRTMSKKYELTTESKIIDGHTVYRIKALKGFKTIIGRRVNAGDLGGWVESEANLSHEGTCWLFDEAAGYENSRRYDNSVGHGNSRQSGNSRQYGDSWQYEDSQQSGDSQQYGFSEQFGNSRQYGSSRQFGNSCQFGNSHHRTGADDGTGRILCIGPCGEMRRTITIQPDNTIVAGCFHGNFDEFRRAVAAKYGEDYGAYSACVAAVQAVLRVRVNKWSE